VRPAEVVRRAAVYLDRHGVESPAPTAETLLMTVLGVERAELYTRTDGLTSGEARAFGRALCLRCTGTPVQHLTGEQAFRRLSLVVRPGVFIPRPETEVLAGVALDAIGDVPEPVVADVGAGTGAIALAIKDERPVATVFAIDRSPAAVELARLNAHRLELDVTALEGDLLAPLPAELRGRVDLVVSNPPYVAADEYESLPADVRADPRSALVGDIELYGRLAAEAASWLGRGGVLVVEVDARDAGVVVGLLVRAGFSDVRKVKDLNGRDRVVLGRRP
jgi:release factor glutamine methyltransferase